MEETLFSVDARRVLGPTLEALGFEFYAFDDDVVDRERYAAVVFYRSMDMKVQIYWSSREGGMGCMVAPPSAPDIHGLLDKSGVWIDLLKFALTPEIPATELLKQIRAESKNVHTMDEWLELWAKRLVRYVDAARRGVVKLYGQ